MIKLKQLSVGKQVLLTFGALCAILLVGGGLFFFSLQAIERSNAMQQSRSLDKLALIDDTAQDVGQLQAQVLREVLASDLGEIKKLDQAVRDIEKINAKELTDYQKFADTEKERQLYDKVMRARKAYWEQTQRIMAFSLVNKDAEATELINSTQASAYDELIKAINELLVRVEADANETARATTRFISKIRIIGDMLIGLTILIVIGTARFVIKVTRRLRGDNRVLQNEITERQGAEEALRWKTAFFEAQVDSSLDGIMVVNENDKKILQNQRAADLLKLPQHVVDNDGGKQQLQWVKETVKNPDQFIERVNYIRSHPGEISRDEVEFKDGTILDRYSSPVVGKDGKSYGRIFTFRDITQQRRIGRELEEARAAAAVRESAQRYHFLADTVPLIIWTARPDGCLDYYNKTWSDYTGLTLAQTQDWGWGAVVHPDDLQPCINRWTHSFSTGENYEIEYRFKRGADGAYRWFLGRASACRNKEGEIVQWVGTCTDIDDQKRAESDLQQAHSALEDKVAERTAELAKTNQTLQRQHIELRVLFDLVPAMIWFKDTKNRILRVNKRVAETAGKPVEEIEGKPSLEIYPQEAARFYADDLEVIRLGVPKLGYVETVPGPDGKEIWVQTDKVPYRDKDGKVVGIVVMAQDITERKRAEQSLRESEERFRQLAENISDVFWMTSPDLQQVHYVSPAYEQVWGRSAANASEHPQEWAEAILPEDRAHVLATFGKLMSNERSASVEFRIARPDGQVRWIHSRGFQVLDVAGKVIRLTGIATDITERKKIEAHLFQAQKMETVGKLAGGIAHEFNSILTAIIGHSELLLGGLPTGSPLAKNAAEISKSAGRAAILTRQLLAYGRKQTLRPEILDLDSLLADMESALCVLLGRDVNVLITRTAGRKAVKIDLGQLQQVIMNIATNASDAMPSGGKLAFETAIVNVDQGNISGFPELQPGEYVALSIADTGTGMSEEVKARVFEPFFTTKGIGQGTGLGLSMCDGIIKQSGGHISVYSEPARGATFTIYLPRVEWQTKTTLQSLDAPDLPHGTETILLVEDDAAFRQLAAALLRRLGYTVLAANSNEALSLKQPHNIGHVDLLFTNAVVPDMSDKQLSERVQELYPNSKILFTIVSPENSIVHQGVLSKGVAFLQKPFTPSALAHKLREVLDRPAALL